MQRKWILKIETESDKQGSYIVHLGLEDPKSQQSVELIAPCNNVDLFQNEVHKLIGELQHLVEDARKKAASLSLSKTEAPKLSPDRVWKQMEGFATEQEMFDFFNSFNEQQRQEVAEYIFTNVNMFKGLGPVFSEHYNSASHVLE